VDIKFGRFEVQIPGQTVVNRVFFQSFSSSSRVEYLFTRYAFNLLNNYQDKVFIKELISLFS
jgi:hypothetical protein